MAYYISYEDFAVGMKNNIYVRERWNTLDQQGREILHQMVHDEINDTEYIGDQIESVNAFPRNFDTMINEKYYLYNANQLDFLKKWNRKIPTGLNQACIKLGQDMLLMEDYVEILRLMESSGSSKVEGKDLKIDANITGSVKYYHKRKYDFKSTRIIDKFRPINFGMMR